MHGHGIAESIKVWVIGILLLIVVAYASPAFNTIWTGIDFSSFSPIIQAGSTVFPYIFVVIGVLLFYWFVIKRE